jgi:hypothetical protein
MDRKTGTKNVNGKPHIDAIDPVCALPGGEVRIVGSGLGPHELRRPRVSFGDVDGPVVISSEQFIVARVPEGAASGEVVVSANGSRSNPQEVRIAVPIAESLHPVCQPGRRRARQYLCDLLRLARTEGPGRHLSHRHQLQRSSRSCTR